MSGVMVKPASAVEGTVTVPGDKSISHRAALLGGMAEGETRITNFLAGDDCLSTLACLAKLGVTWERRGSEVWLQGKGTANWREPEDVLDVGNSGTTARLFLGALAASPLAATLTGDASIRQRPMRRVTDPLKRMGAAIIGRRNGDFVPLTIRGGGLKGYAHRTEVASAQVKSALLLAGLGADGVTSVEEPQVSRDHTERMLRAFGVPVTMEGRMVQVRGGSRLRGQTVAVPADISSAAFFLVLGSLAGRGEIVLPEVGINPTRTGILDVLRRMGADIEVLAKREPAGEGRATLRVRPADLHGTEIAGEIIPRLIDEVPILAVAASLAEGETVIRDAAELRVKETDRIQTVADGLRGLGADVEELPDGLRIRGKKRLPGGRAKSYGDHRLAMSWAVAGLLSQEGVAVEGMEAAAVSFPDFLAVLDQIVKR
ncbi:3-phosphoshikimate 1-carboxyvinyltransferase [Acididesulfobacillus acetoxydans]|uniref:3-phosphoshikimate 1-carboxyvinyltransferase n=1 Tax=Acididesulfobacillus acetoxydans TaxID=1561005 RepID=A0A8S0W8S4_9FIRM|nr:3-phosphoshikimate 1-carboxyvinyltransferase [Acididesulfobacillus acetoxydans]CAA7602039.1 3-phosphoshikimate 1-carboxyvinyltransferase [Acididesulfobacillus acetoxydans]CEJ08118.1 3-phosphoshikimate 1-carboxyvinyltransferase [Acididesulfobacillus acetoxydans]